MLSHPPQSALQARRSLHRRQNSTPTGVESMKIAANLPPSMHQRAQQHDQRRQQLQGHRRGMSLDTRHHHQQQQHIPMQHQRQDFATVSTTNTTGHNNPQHVLREAQQQRIARPGLSQQQPPPNQGSPYTSLNSDENYLMSPHGTPQMQPFDNQRLDGLAGSAQAVDVPFDMYPGQMNAMMRKGQEQCSENGLSMSQDFDLFPPSHLSTPTFVNFQDPASGATNWMAEGDSQNQGQTPRHYRRVSQGLSDRVAKFENLGGEAPSRPLTPSKQNAADYCPLTPMETPHDRTIKHAGRPQRFSDGYDESMEETLKPVKASSSRRPNNTFEAMRQAAEGRPLMPSPPRGNSVSVTGAFPNPSVAAPSFMNMGVQDGEVALQTQFDGMPAVAHPMSAASDYSQNTSPVAPMVSDFNPAWKFETSMAAAAALSPDMFSGEESPAAAGELCSRRNSPHRRTESVASVQSAASIAALDIEKTKMMTGVTMDEIHQFIEGPDAKDNKWMCTFEDCNKKFGRKENIKSHVQTHLNDRQYQCPTCNKCFVRQHDLKRHAKIHTGIKPYPCECGNSFARHDALTRHKQRGMCIGAFDGVVRKVVKRGRPRKHRPDMDDRVDKAERTRRKNNQSVSSVCSSLSGYSDTSGANSPDDDGGLDAPGSCGGGDPDFDMLDDIMDVSLGGTSLNPTGLQAASSAPMPALGSDLPAASSGSAHSPSAASVHSYVSQLSHMSLHPDPVLDAASLAHSSQPCSPAKSASSPFNEPPELSQSSSPPSCNNRYFDLEPSSAGGADVMISSSADASGIPSLAGLNDAEDDLFLQFTNNDPNMLLLPTESKFDEAFDSSDMFASRDDFIFTGS